VGTQASGKALTKTKRKKTAGGGGTVLRFGPAADRNQRQGDPLVFFYFK